MFIERKMKVPPNVKRVVSSIGNKDDLYICTKALYSSLLRFPFDFLESGALEEVGVERGSSRSMALSEGAEELVAVRRARSWTVQRIEASS